MQVHCVLYLQYWPSGHEQFSMHDGGSWVESGQTQIGFPFTSKHFALPQNVGQTGWGGGQGGFLEGFVLQTHTSGDPFLPFIHISFGPHFFLQSEQVGGDPPLGQVQLFSMQTPLHVDGSHNAVQLSVAHLHVDFPATTTHS
jgi:hypothetical protein